MLKATPRNEGAKGIGTSAVPKDNRTQPPTLADLGLDLELALGGSTWCCSTSDPFDKVLVVVLV